MIALTVAQIAAIVGGELADISAEDAASRHVTATVEFDSRKVTSGGLFLALPGARADGHDHAASAVAAGAVAVLAARPVGVPALIVPDVQAALGTLARAVISRLPGLTVIGITGSAGKTTTKDLLAQLL